MNLKRIICLFKGHEWATEEVDHGPAHNGRIIYYQGSRAFNLRNSNLYSSTRWCKRCMDKPFHWLSPYTYMDLYGRKES